MQSSCWACSQRVVSFDRGRAARHSHIILASFDRGRAARHSHIILASFDRARAARHSHIILASFDRGRAARHSHIILASFDRARAARHSHMLPLHDWLAPRAVGAARVRVLATWAGLVRALIPFGAAGGAPDALPVREQRARALLPVAGGALLAYLAHLVDGEQGLVAAVAHVHVHVVG